MKLLPRSLFGRNALVIVMIVVLGQLSALLLLRQVIMLPRMDTMAEAAAHNVGAVRAALQGLPKDQRQAFVQRFNRHLEAHARPVDENARLWLMPLSNRFVGQVAEALRDKGAEVAWQREVAGMALKLSVEGEDYWIVLHGLLPGRTLTGVWLMVAVAGVLLAGMGALLIHRFIHRPLRLVVTAADTLAQGGTPTRLIEEGPTETASLSRSFNRLVHSLEEADRERALMLAGVSHDLRTPLTKLRLGTEILAEQAPDDLQASLVRSIEEMDAIVGQFVDFAQAGETEPAVREKLESLAREQAESAAAYGRPLRLELGAAPAVSLRPRAMRRALANLVENAWRHGAPPVVLRTGADHGGVWIEVADAGPGITPAERDMLRQPFRRGDSARSGPPGAGLGLAIVDRIARAHGARLDLLENLPAGTRARITLPRP
jgi:two-component system osmolarity sensor histidine kinase EnvZ